MRKLLAVLYPSTWARLFRAMLGDLRYTPPAWIPATVEKLTESMSRRPATWASIILLSGISFVSYHLWQDWWEKHKPRPKMVVEVKQVKGRAGLEVAVLGRWLHSATVGSSAAPVASWQPTSLEIRFDADIAPLEQMGKRVSSGIKMQPALPGEWRWSGGSRLLFAPGKPWAPGQELRLTYDGAVSSGAVLEERSWQLQLPTVEDMQIQSEFYTDPRNPELHEAVFTLQSQLPYSPAEVEKHLQLEVMGKTHLFPKAKPGERPYTFTTGNAQGTVFYVRTLPIEIPEKEDWVKLTLSPGLQCLHGGQATKEAASTRVRVPDISSGFSLTDFRADIVPTEEGDPEQTLFIQTSGYVRGEELEKHLSAWLLPIHKPADEHGPAEQHFSWGNPIFYTPQVMALAQRVPLKRVETEKEEGAPMATMHAFKLPPSAPMQLLVKVGSGLRALGGFRLAKTAHHLVQIPQLTRELGIDSRGGLLALNGERKLSVKYRGVGHLRFTLARVPFSQLNHLARLTEGDFQSPYWKTDFDEHNVARISREVRQVALQNEYAAHYTSYDFQSALSSQDSNDPDASRGLFFLTVEGVEKRKMTRKLKPEEAKDSAELRDWLPMSDELREQRFVLITDLGVVLKRNADLTADVFVQSVGRGEPVASAQIMVLGKNGEFLTQTQTDAQGHAVLPDLSHHKRERLPVCVVARLGNDVAFLPYQRPDRLLDFSRFDTGGVLASQHRALDAFLFTERGIYRPGDEVHVSGMVKRRDWAGHVVGLPMRVEVRDAKNDVVLVQRLPLPEDGFFDLTLPTAETSPTGSYSARLYLDLPALQAPDAEQESHELLAIARFRVEDFQPDRMKMSLQLQPAPTQGWVKPGEAQAIVHVQTLFDAPAAQRRVQAKLVLDPGAFSFHVHQDYTFHNPMSAVELAHYGHADATAGSGRSVSLGELKTDDAGDAVFDLNLGRFADGVFSLELLAEAFEADGGRSVRTSQSLLVAPQDYVVGWKADGDLGYIGKDVPRVVQWLALSPTLQPIAVQGLQQRLVQVRYVSVLTRQESGSYAYVSTQREDVLSSIPLALAATGAQLQLPTARPGEYRLELVNEQQQVICITPFSVVGEGDSSRSMERDAELQLKLQKEELAAGETLQFSLRAPFTGAGLVTIEREKVLSWHWIKQTTLDATHSIPLPADLEGTAYVNVAFVRGLDSPEVFTTPLSYAVAPFRCQVEKRKLPVKLDAPTRVKPGETLHMSYQSAQPARIILYAVDEGILQVTDYKLPAPLQHFNQKRALEVETEQLLDLIIPEFSLLTKNKAYGGGESGRLRLRLNPFQRRKEAPVVYWSGILDCGPERQELAYTVPDYFTGSLRIMAVAVNSAGIGTAELSTVVKGPLILTPTAPFHAAPGDSFTASLNVVNNTEGSTATSDLIIQTSHSEHLQLTGQQPQELHLTLAPGKEATLRFPILVQPRLGGAELRWTVRAGTESSTRSTTLSVRPAVPYSTHLQSGYWRTAEHEVPVPRQLHTDFRQMEATVSTTPLGLARGLETYLAAYPHGCSEQITSKAMSKLLLADEADFGLDKAKAAELLHSTFSQLRVRQNANGGFGYWGDTCSTEPEFLSLYVTSFLIEARDAGYAVPADLLQGARERLKQMARHKTRSLPEADLQAQAIYLLTRQGEVTTNALLMLRDMLDTSYKDASWTHSICAAYLASTYMLLKQEKEATALMALHRSKCSTEPKLTRWYGGWWQEPRVEDAQRFSLLCRHFPEVAAEFGYDDLRVITEPMSRGFINTISSAQTILALKSYATLAKQSAVTVSVSQLSRSGGQPQLLTVPRSGLSRTAFSPDAGKLLFALDQKGTDLGAFYQTVQAGFDLQAPTQSLAEGLEVHRELQDDTGKPVTQLKVGQGVKVVLHLRNISPDHQSYIALTDLMPGGFEIENNSLRPGLSTLPATEYVDVREDRNILYTSLAKGGSITFIYRIKPTTAGTYTLPSVYAESMYDPSYRGQSTAGKITVTPAE